MAKVITPFAVALAEAGGAAAAASATAGLRHSLRAALVYGQSELVKAKSGYGDPVTVGFASGDGHLLAVLPVAVGFAADPAGCPPRAQILVGGVVAALHDLTDAEPATDSLRIRVGEHDGFLVLGRSAFGVPPGDLDDLAPVAFEERLGSVDRLRAEALAVPFAVLGDVRLREPIGAAHPIRIAEAVAVLGGDPAQPASLDAIEEKVLAIVGRETSGTRPHDDPDPARRIARRMLQRLDGFGKWGGYHTEFAHLTRGFAGNERAFAQRVAEALIDEGLLAEKPSVGQRHVFLNPRRVADIRTLIGTGDTPPGLELPRR